MSSPQFTVYGHGGPNPWKVVLVLEELGLTYDIKMVDSTKQEQKKKPYTDLNPNGRMPTLVDHKNNDFTIWESGAIVLYLVEKYDTANKLHFANFESEALAKQYLIYQVSGQGPYFGQLVWFNRFHDEKLPSAIERYSNEAKRVIGVLDGILAGKEYLVDNKLSYADLSFVPWMWILDWPQLNFTWKADYPNTAAWLERLNARPAAKKTQEVKAAHS